VKIFAFDPADYRQHFAREGWVHIENGIDPEFLAELQKFTRHSLEKTRLDRFAIKGKKEQSLYEFPNTVDFPGEIFDVVSDVCGLRRETMTVSERHIQAYELDADPEPDPHKDRYPSQISLGFSVEVPAESRLVLYPYDERSLNPFNSAATFQRSLQPHERPSVALRDARPVELDDSAGDVVMFHGSTTWHLRRRSAGSVNLYVKLNDFDCDPLGEDPGTPLRRERTLELFGGGDDSLDERVPAVSRRLDFVSRQYGRQPGVETLHVALYGSEPMGMTPAQFEIVRAADGLRTMGEVVAAVTAAGHDCDDVVRDARALVENGVLDLMR
jgi:hypothetical protein